MNRLDLLKSKRDEILRLAARHGARNLRIFGSTARGEADEESDMDFLIEMAPQHTPFFPAGLVVDLTTLLGCDVDVVTEQALHWHIRDRVLREAVPV